jgi:hypothetical protein
MSNIFNDQGRLYTLDTDDIITLWNHLATSGTPARGLKSIWIDKICLRPSAASNSVEFHTLQVSKTPTIDIDDDTFTVTSTSRITDDSGTIFSGAAIGDWVNIHSSPTSGNNTGWYYINAVAGGNTYIDVEDDTNALTDEANKIYSMDIYTPEKCIHLVSRGTEVVTEKFDGKKKHFINLGMKALTAGAVDIYIA